jgi:SWI/SNF-related matrix-associated actin-dependent regulator of chromatin subfamily B protein 1
VEYNPDPEYHMRKEGDSRTPGKKKAAALRAQSAAAAATPVDISAPATPATKNGDLDTHSRRSPSPMKDDDDRAISPVSTASSASEPPLAQKFNKLNGTKVGTPRSSGAKETNNKGSVKPITPREKADTPVVKEEKKSMMPKVKSENGQEVSPPASVHAPSSTSEVAPPANVVSKRLFPYRII